VLGIGMEQLMCWQETRFCRSSHDLCVFVS
jgi:hypothetical protein